MNSAKSNRFTGYKLPNGKELKNRVVVPPMASGTADPNGFVTPETLGHYENLAKSGAALVMVEYTYVDLSGRSEDKQLGIQSDRHIVGLTQVAKRIHAAGALAGLQITHAGGKTSVDLTGGVLWAPSNVPVPVKDREMGTPTPMSYEEITQWKSAFLQASHRAVSAGFDILEFHSAHGYGLNQWLSPLTNHRTDEYGGSLENRCRLLLEIISEVRAAHSELILAVRMPGQDFLQGGLTIQDTQWVAGALERKGVDIIDVSSGIGGWRRPRDRDGEGYLVKEAQLIQSVVSVPVIGVGGIRTASFIDRSVEQGVFSLAAVGRAILEAPLHWKEEQMTQY